MPNFLKREYFLPTNEKISWADERYHLLDNLV
jgi:hypothetical protein